MRAWSLLVAALLLGSTLALTEALSRRPETSPAKPLTGLPSTLAGRWQSRDIPLSDRELDLLKLTESARRGLKVTPAMRLDVKAFYDQRDDAPAWINDTGVAPNTASALSVLDQAVEHGLNRADYDTDALQSEFNALAAATSPDADRLMQFEARLTSALLSLGHDVAIGRTSPASLDGRWISQRTPPDVSREQRRERVRQILHQRRQFRNQCEDCLNALRLVLPPSGFQRIHFADKHERCPNRRMRRLRRGSRHGA